MLLLDRGGAWRNQVEEAAMIAAMDAAYIAADMGTGKSRAALLGLENQSVILIVCPIAVGSAWRKQLGLWDPSREVLNLIECGTTSQRAERLKSLEVSGRRVAVIVNYDSAWRQPLGKALESVPWDAILLDESHRIKAPGGKASRWLAKLAAMHSGAKRVCMSGTPTPHSPLDWWSQFRFLDPGILGPSYTAYRSRIAVTHPQYPGWVKAFRPEALESLSRRIDPYVYRIQAEDVITLPDAIHTEISVTLPPKARKVYDSLERDMIAILEESGERITAANKLSLVLRLQQATSGFPAGIPLYEPGESPKERALADLLEDLSEPLVIFCKFVADLDAVTAVLRKSGRTVSELSGRKKSLESWQNGETDALVVQQQAGGVGVDLTRSCVAVYYSLSHSLGDYQQSLARLRRPGQTRPCRYLHLVVSDSVDESIYAAIEAKRDVVEEVFSRLQSRKESVMISTGTATLVSFDMSNEEYHSERQHISRSTAFRYRGVFGGVSQQYEDSGKKIFGGNSSTDFGSIVDTAVGLVMTGQDWRSAVISPPSDVLAADGSRRGKAYTEWRSANVQPGVMECSPADHAKVSEIVEQLYGHANSRRLIEDTASSQMSVFWKDENGHDRKARADGVTHGGEWWDLKTTSSDWRSLKYSFRQFGYLWQARWYLDAAIAAGAEPFDFKFVVVQTFAPYAVQVFTVPQHELDNAGREIRDTLDDIRRRRETGEYLSAEYHAVKELEF